MTARNHFTDLLHEQLFSGEGCVYAVLDGAGIPDLRDKLYSLRPDAVCLYPGELEPDMAAVAPYLVRLERDDAFTKWLLEKGWRNAWGIFAVSDAELPALQQHFRRHLIVYNREGRPMFFRFYDPRVLEPVLAKYRPRELQNFFGPVSSFALSHESGEAMLQLRVRDGRLKRTPTALRSTMS